MKYIRIDPEQGHALIEEPLTYEDVARIVGYPVEAKPIFRGQAYLYMCEDGKRLALPYNALATTLMRGLIKPDDFIVGTVLIVGPPDGRGMDTAVPGEVWLMVEAMASKEATL